MSGFSGVAANFICSQLPGVGKKTAELLVVELRDKCELLLATWGASAAPTASSSPTGAKRQVIQDVASALTGLGFARQSLTRCWVT